MIRIKDIADRAGVSPTTVSNVIHGKTGRVSKATVEKINRILKEMEYVPSISARMLANNSSGLIGVALGFMKKGNASSFEDPFVSAMLGNLEYQIREHGYYMMLVARHEQDDIMQQALGWNFDGMIAMALKAEQAVIEALDAGAASVDLEEKDVYRKPGITQDDEALNGEMAELNHLTAARITYAIGENSYAIDRATLQSWLVQGEDGTYTISQDEAAAFVRHMAYETDTFGLAHTFKTSLGVTINLNAGGDYGWCIDKEETTQALLQAIEDETQGNLDPVYLYTANDRSANDIGNTYVEVCISQQKMWCYKDGVLVTETPVTTGNHATGYDTPAGSVWAVDAKKSDCDFKLYPSHVMFWLPFNGDVGIHDASWRTEYGGDIYLTNRSHGCVNTPYTEAEKVFNAIEIGDPVIVYYSLDDVTGPQPTQKNSL